MKKSLLSLAFLSVLAVMTFSGCAEDPLALNQISMGSSGVIQINVSADKAITVTASQITNAVITLTLPSGSVQTSVWNPGGPSSFSYTASETGTYTLGVRQTDTSNNTLSTNVSYSFQKGNNYTISISLGGAIFMTCGAATNTASSVSSSAISSAVSSASSVSSAASSSVSSSSSRSSSSVSSINSSSYSMSYSSSSQTSSSVSSSSSKSSSSSVSSSSSASSISGITVYTAGKIGSGANYWINSASYDISEAAYSYATGIFVSGTDVYVSGRRNTGYACYWKNGTANTVSDHMLSVASDVYVSGGNVTVVGNYLTSWYPFQPMVWINGSGTSLGGRSLSAVTVDGSSVYISGQGGAATTVASYWIMDGSGTRQFNLTPDTNGYYSDTTGIAEANGTVYVAGFYYYSGASDYVATYWYGTAGTSLSQVLLETSRPSRTGKACYSGSTLYISGYYNNGVNNVACYWVVNPGVSAYRVDLGTAGYDSFASAVAVKGSTVVVSGYQNNGANNVACYWQNGIRTDIGPAGQNSTADAVAVK